MTLAARLSERVRDGLAEGFFVGGAERAKLTDDEGLLEGSEHGLDGGRLEQTRSLPILEPDLA